MSGVSEDISDADAEKILKDLEPLLDELKEALAGATESLEKAANKRDILTRSCSKNCFVGKATGIVEEVSFTLKGVVNGLGAGMSPLSSLPLERETSRRPSC
jgi:hypothetical protein